MPYPDYAKEKELCKDFLQTYSSFVDGQKKYQRMLQEVSNRALSYVVIELDDILESGGQFEDLVSSIRSNARRYLSLFAEAIDEVMPEPTELHQVDDVYDVLMRTRMQATGDNAEGNTDPWQKIPPPLKRRYELSFKPVSKDKLFSLREVKASHMGQLVTIKGIVTRATDIKPLLTVATYTCDDCHFEVYQEVTSRTFQPLVECPTRRCVTNRSKGHLHLQTRGSKFTKFQEARIQELPEQVPRGHIPRTMTVHFRGPLTRQVSPGDLVTVTGVFLPTPFTGFRAMRAGLVADTYLDAMFVEQSKKRYTDYAESPEAKAALERLLDEGGDVYSRLAASIAPEIYGHEDIKRALLLLLVGAPTRRLKDGMHIRGDVHVCLMGDPGVAKSQLLKHITSVAPRGVYTTGRGSSGVGLTAAVTRDTVTNEMVLEGGALVLADMGICAIDEFDKMDESDRTAIHEVMEQQTVSIAKAGITTTLNARTSVLAAANPAWGRYDISRSPTENINLPPALLSRFDILWLILDTVNPDNDTSLARHVIHVHQHSEPPALAFQPVEAATLRAFVAHARTFTPFFPRELTEYVASEYATLRQQELESEAPHTYTTARTLLSILRLSEALARLRFSGTVIQRDVDEALRLMEQSKMSLYDEEFQQNGNSKDPTHEIYQILRDEVLRRFKDTRTVPYETALGWIHRKNFTEAQLREALDAYAISNIWQIDAVTNDIHFIS